MKLTFALVAMLALAAPFVVAQDTADKPVTADKQVKFDPTRDAAKDIAYGVALAKKENKRVLLDVGGEWCPWCHKLDKMFKEDKEVAEYLKAKYVVIKINMSQENENKEVLSKYPEIPGYPHLFVLGQDGKLLRSQGTGDLETGDHHDHEKVMTFLKKWAGE